MRKVGVLSLKEVDTSKLPDKWDIADPVPENFGKTFLKDSILRANSKAIGLEKLVPLQKETHLDLRTLNAITEDIDSRLRPELEQKHGEKTWEIEEQILSEVRAVIKSNDNLCTDGEKIGELSKSQVYLERNSAQGKEQVSLEI